MNNSQQANVQSGKTPQQLEEERKKRLQAIADRCSTCDCMYPCSDARSANRSSMSGRPYD